MRKGIALIAGYSPDASPLKFARVAYLTEMHSRAVRGILSREGWADPRYHWIEPHCGPGTYPNGDRGCALRVAEILSKELPGQYRLILNDLDPSNAVQHENAIRQYCQTNVFTLDCGDFVNGLIYHITRPIFGFIFFDPNGGPNWEAINRFSCVPRFERCDILVNVNSVGIKWARKNAICKNHTKTATQHLREINKKYLFLWEPNPSDNWQFSLVVATNWGAFPQFEKLGFYLIDSPKGKLIADRMDYTREERHKRRDARQGRLFPEENQ